MTPNFFLKNPQGGPTELKFQIWGQSTQWLLSFDTIPDKATENWE